MELSVAGNRRKNVAAVCGWMLAFCWLTSYSPASGHLELLIGNASHGIKELTAAAEESTPTSTSTKNICENSQNATNRLGFTPCSKSKDRRIPKLKIKKESRRRIIPRQVGEWPSPRAIRTLPSTDPCYEGKAVDDAGDYGDDDDSIIYYDKTNETVSAGSRQWQWYKIKSEKLKLTTDLADRCTTLNQREELSVCFEKADEAPFKTVAETRVREIMDIFTKQKAFVSDTGEKVSGKCWNDERNVVKTCGTCWRLPPFYEKDLEETIFNGGPACFTLAYDSLSSSFHGVLMVNDQILNEIKYEKEDIKRVLGDKLNYFYAPRPSQQNSHSRIPKLRPGLFYPLNYSTSGERCIFFGRNLTAHRPFEDRRCFTHDVRIWFQIMKEDERKVDVELQICTNQKTVYSFLKTRNMFSTIGNGKTDVRGRASLKVIPSLYHRNPHTQPTPDPFFQGSRTWTEVLYKMKCLEFKQGVIVNPQFCMDGRVLRGSYEDMFDWDESKEPTFTFESGETETDMPVKTMMMKNISEIVPELPSLLENISEKIDIHLELNTIHAPPSGPPTKRISWSPVGIKDAPFLAVLYATPLPAPMTAKTVKEWRTFQPVLNFLSEDITTEWPEMNFQVSPQRHDACGGVLLARDTVLTICACIRYFYLYNKLNKADIPAMDSGFDILSNEIFVTFSGIGFNIDQTVFQLAQTSDDFMKESKCFRAIAANAGSQTLQTSVVAMPIRPHLDSFERTPIIPWIQIEKFHQRKTIQADMIDIGLRSKIPLYDQSRRPIDAPSELVKIQLDECSVRTKFCEQAPGNASERIDPDQPTKCFCARTKGIQLCQGVVGFPLLTKEGIIGLNAKPFQCKDDASVLAVTFDERDIVEIKRYLPQADFNDVNLPTTTTAETPGSASIPARLRTFPAISCLLVNSIYKMV